MAHVCAACAQSGCDGPGTAHCAAAGLRAQLLFGATVWEEVRPTGPPVKASSVEWISRRLAKYRPVGLIRPQPAPTTATRVPGWAEEESAGFVVRGPTTSVRAREVLARYSAMTPVDAAHTFIGRPPDEASDGPPTNHHAVEPKHVEAFLRSDKMALPLQAERRYLDILRANLRRLPYPDGAPLPVVVDPWLHGKVLRWISTHQPGEVPAAGTPEGAWLRELAALVPRTRFGVSAETGEVETKHNVLVCGLVPGTPGSESWALAVASLDERAVLYYDPVAAPSVVPDVAWLNAAVVIAELLAGGERLGGQRTPWRVVLADSSWPRYEERAGRAPLALLACTYAAVGRRPLKVENPHLLAEALLASMAAGPGDGRNPLIEPARSQAR